MHNASHSTLDREEIVVEFYSAGNFGDDLFLNLLLSRYPDRTFRLVCDEGVPDFCKKFKNLTISYVSSPNAPVPRKINSFLRRRNHQKILISLGASRKCLVNVGGSIFIQPSGNGLLGNFYGKKMIRDRRQEYSAFESTFVVGANFGPYQSDGFRTAFHDIFQSSCEDVCFRDTYSASLFSDLDNVRCASDVLFLTDLPTIRKDKAAFISVIDLRNRIRSPKLQRVAPAYEQWVVNASKWFAEAGYEIVLGSFCCQEGDENALTRIAQRLDVYDIPSRQVCYRGDTNLILDTIASSEVVIASRFHAMILGLVAGARVLTIPYSRKFNNVMEDVGMDKCLVVDLATIDPCDMSACSAILNSDPFDASAQIADAERQFEALDSFFGRKSS